MLTIPARVIASVFMLLCFAGTIIVGLINGNGWKSIMLSATIVAFVAWVIGSVIGALALRSVNEQIELHRQQNPIPTEHQNADSRIDKNRPAIG